LDKVDTGPVHGHEHAHDHAHEELGFWSQYVFSQDHKVIGDFKVSAVRASCFLSSVGFCCDLIGFAAGLPRPPDSRIGNWFGPGTRAARRHHAAGVLTTSWARCTAPSWCSLASCQLAVGGFGTS